MRFPKRIVKKLLSYTPYEIVSKDGNAIERSKLQAHHPTRWPVHVDSGFVMRRNPQPDDIEIVERLLKFYEYVSSISEFKSPTAEDMWTDFVDNYHADFIRAFQTKDTNTILQHLCNLGANRSFQGIGQGTILNDYVHSESVTRMVASNQILDSLVSLAEMLGVLPLENPEQGHWDENIYIPQEIIAQKIESKVGTSIFPPQLEGGNFGIRIKNGFLSPRDIYCFESAYRILQILGRESSAVCEIGAGVGKAAYWSWQLGIRDYSIFDLPHVAVISAYYLIKSLPVGAVVLYGEENINSTEAIKIFPYWVLKNMPEKHFKLTLNQDSLPEMDKAIALDYLRSIKAVTAKYFLSINQEGENHVRSCDKPQHRVCELMKEVPGFESCYRFKCWTRPGYVEELFELEH